jgi:hypothetical protein
MNGAHADATAILVVAQKVDAGATVSGVSKLHADVLIKIAPSSDVGTATALTMMTAVKLSFPFAAVTAVENVVSGTTELHVIVYARHEKFARARAVVAERRVARWMATGSRACLVSGVVAYGCLLYASSIKGGGIDV